MPHVLNMPMDQVFAARRATREHPQRAVQVLHRREPAQEVGPRHARPFRCPVGLSGRLGIFPPSLPRQLQHGTSAWADRVEPPRRPCV